MSKFFFTRLYINDKHITTSNVSTDEHPSNGHFLARQEIADLLDSGWDGQRSSAGHPFIRYDLFLEES